MKEAGKATPVDTLDDGPSLVMTPHSRVMTAHRLRHRREHVAPLSSTQSRLWFLYQLRPGGNEFALQIALRLTGALDPEAVRTALNGVVARHEPLRTVITVGSGGVPVQRVLPDASVELRQVSAPGGDGVALAAAELSTSFDLEHRPPITACLARTDENEHVLVITMHHIASDGWSSGIFLRELEIGYNAARRGEPADIPAPPLSYTDYCWWERESRLDDEDRLVKYWCDQLAGCEDLALPADRDGVGGGGAIGSVRFAVAERTVLGLHKLARAEGASLFAVAFAAWQVLLHRYSGQCDFTVGTAVAGRRNGDVAGLIGCFVNTLCLPARVRPGDTFRSVVGSVRDRLADVLEHESLPFDRVVRELRRDARTPLYRAYCAYVDEPPPRFGWDGLAVDVVIPPREQSDFELNATFWKSGPTTLEVQVAYSRAIFDDNTAAGIGRCLSVLLDWAAVRPDRAVGDLPLLPPAERRAVVALMSGGGGNG
jgi:hypothetical protein